jgi:hypothetical protein
VARLWLSRILLVVATWSKDLFIIFIAFVISFTSVEDYEQINGLLAKKSFAGWGRNGDR